jgi:prolyl-tRNA synthetase
MEQRANAVEEHAKELDDEDEPKDEQEQETCKTIAFLAEVDASMSLTQYVGSQNVELSVIGQGRDDDNPKGVRSEEALESLVAQFGQHF